MTQTNYKKLMERHALEFKTMPDELLELCLKNSITSRNDLQGICSETSMRYITSRIDVIKAEITERKRLERMKKIRAILEDL